MITVFILVLGLMIGSFINAFVWRAHEKTVLRNRHSRPNRGSSKKLDSRVKPENKTRLKELSILSGRSMCTKCRHTLKWYDLIPVVSWLTLKGKCRYCKHKITWLYPVVELAFAVALATSFQFWPFEFVSVLDYGLFVLWSFILVFMTSLLVYDLKWLELPTEWVYTAGIASVVFVGLSLANGQELAVLRDGIIGAFVLGGLFWCLYQVSSGAWIGGGDVRLGFTIGILLGWQKAIFALSVAAYIGTVIVFIAIVLGKYKKRMKLPFGPLLIAGWYISFLWGQDVIDWYLRLIGAA